MARYIEAQCRVCRREGCKLFLKGERCYTDKCSISRRNYAPGDHGQKKAKLSEYGTQLREKQKTRSYYGVGVHVLVVDRPIDSPSHFPRIRQC